MEKMANQTLRATERVFLMMTMGQILEVYPYVAELQFGSGPARASPSPLLPRSGRPGGLDAKGHHVILGPSHQYNPGNSEGNSRGNRTDHPQTARQSRRYSDDQCSEEQSFPGVHHRP
jgi:hypothetical protein